MHRPSQRSRLHINVRLPTRRDLYGTQHISAGASSIQGGGGGVWRYDNGILSDTKQRATLDRFVRNGVEVPSSDPEWQQIYRDSQANLGVTSSGPIRLEGDVAYSGMYICHRQR